MHFVNPTHENQQKRENIPNDFTSPSSKINFLIDLKYSKKYNKVHFHILICNFFLFYYNFGSLDNNYELPMAKSKKDKICGSGQIYKLYE